MEDSQQLLNSATLTGKTIEHSIECPAKKNKISHNIFESPIPLPVLETKIIAATFLKKKLPLQDQNCIKIGEKDAQMLQIILRIANSGRGDYVVNPSELIIQDKCSSKQSQSAFYSISISNLSILQPESSIQDTIPPLKYTIVQQGISAGNYQISQLSVDVTSANLEQGNVYDVTVTVLPCDSDLISKSDVYKANFSPERRRTLRKHK